MQQQVHKVVIVINDVMQDSVHAAKNLASSSHHHPSLQ